MGNTSRGVADRLTAPQQGGEKREAAAAYRQLLGQVECPQEVRRAALLLCAEKQKQDGQGRKKAALWKYRRFAALVAYTMLTLCILTGILFREQIGYALESDRRQGYVYEKVKYEDLEFTKICVNFEKWNQELDMGKQCRSGQYEGCYEDLEQIGLLEVMLPHYRVETYEPEQRKIYYETYPKGWNGVYRNGDSRISINICYVPRTDTRWTVAMPESHKLMRINGIEYDVQYYSRQAGYGERMLMEEYGRQTGGTEPLLAWEKEEDAFFYPIQIECMVNRIYYCFRLTGDIDPQEFLETVSYQLSEEEAAQSGETAQTAGQNVGGARLYPTDPTRTAFTYTEVEYGGLEMVTCQMDGAGANRRLTVSSQQPKYQYEGAYDGLDALDLLAVLLPHYRTQEYSLIDSGNREVQFDREWYGIYAYGDSRISLTVKDMGKVDFTESTDMLSGHESRSVNGVEYEIWYHTRPITYEEYIVMQQYRVPVNYENWTWPRQKYEENYFYYPVEIHCVVNGILHEFEISEDVDLEEFLRSIY